MVIQFTLQGLMIFIVCALGIAAGALLLPILWNTKKIISILRNMIETNQESIEKTIRTMPGILENVTHISGNVSEITDKLKVSVPIILQEVEYVTHATKGSIESANVVIENIGYGINETLATYNKDTSGLIAYVHIFEEVLQIVYRIFSPSK